LIETMKFLNRIDLMALALALATGATWWLGERAHGSPGQAIVLAVLALAVFKGALIALEYMELRLAPALWRRVVMAWLGVVVGLIGLVNLLPG
jgi:hypothetical protein